MIKAETPSLPPKPLVPTLERIAGNTAAVSFEGSVQDSES